MPRLSFFVFSLIALFACLSVFQWYALPVFGEFESENDSNDSGESAAVDAGARAQLLVQKQLHSVRRGLFAVGHPINVSISVYNVGNLPAYAVTIGDNWGDLFEIRDGENTTTVDELGVGERLELNFTVVPSREGQFTGGAASVSYQAEGEGSAPQLAYSTGWRSFIVYSEQVFERYGQTKTVEWVVTVFGYLAPVLVPLFIYLYVEITHENGIPLSAKLKSS